MCFQGGSKTGNHSNHSKRKKEKTTSDRRDKFFDFFYTYNEKPCINPKSLSSVISLIDIYAEVSMWYASS